MLSEFAISPKLRNIFALSEREKRGDPHRIKGINQQSSLEFVFVCGLRTQPNYTLWGRCAKTPYREFEGMQPSI